MTFFGHARLFADKAAGAARKASETAGKAAETARTQVAPSVADSVVRAARRASETAMRASESTRTQAVSAMESADKDTTSVGHTLLQPREVGTGPAAFAATSDEGIPRRMSRSRVRVPSIQIRVCSWNLHGREIAAGDDLSHWLTPSDVAVADIYVIGVQEIVLLGARSVLWGSNGDELRQGRLEERVEDVLIATGEAFVKICSFGMVGQSLLIYVRDSLKHLLADLDCDRVKTGLEGIGGNKGCVCARFALGDLTLCFVNVHLASGRCYTFERNQHMSQILAEAFQGTNRNGGSRPSKLHFERKSIYSIERHHVAIVFGDFNSRLNTDMDDEESWPLGTVDSWLRLDELSLNQISCLESFKEAVVAFPPTYKYVQGTDELSRKRCPAWCDRVLYKALSDAEIHAEQYDSYVALRLTSDHKPVGAQFRVNLSSGASLSSGTSAASKLARLAREQAVVDRAQKAQQEQAESRLSSSGAGERRPSKKESSLTLPSEQSSPPQEEVENKEKSSRPTHRDRRRSDPSLGLPSAVFSPAQRGEFGLKNEVSPNVSSPGSLSRTMSNDSGSLGFWRESNGAVGKVLMAFGMNSS